MDERQGRRRTRVFGFRAPRFRGSGRGAPVEHDVAIQSAPGEALRPPALGVQVGELAGDRAERAGEDVVEHPRLEGHAAVGRSEQAQGARLLRVVDPEFRS